MDDNNFLAGFWVMIFLQDFEWWFSCVSLWCIKQIKEQCSDFTVVIMKLMREITARWGNRNASHHVIYHIIKKKKPILLSGTLFLPQKAQNRALLQINEDNKTSNCWRWIPTQKGGFINIGFLFFTFYGISGSKYFVDLSVMYVNKYFRKFIFRWQTWSALPFLFPSPPPVPSPWSQTPQQINTQKSHFPQRLNEHTKTNIFRYWKQHFHREYSL